jgi:hypothetical protein
MTRKVYVGPKTGQQFTLPTDRNEAVRLGKRRYMDEDGCTTCKDRDPPPNNSAPKCRYVVKSACFGCTHLLLGAAYTLWQDSEIPLQCMGVSRPDPFPTTAAQALHQGVDWYYPGVCMNGPHLLRLSLTTGRCTACADEAAALRDERRSPRAIARAAGQLHYMPNEPCTNCWTLALHSVASNACTNCSSKPMGETPETEIRRSNPGLILSLADAEVLGLRIYRTGKPCGKGHTGFRYVKGGACIECKEMKGQ